MTANTPILYILDFNVGNETDDPEDPFAAGRVAVGSSKGGQLKTLIDHERKPDGIDVLLEDGGHIIWTQMGHPDKNDGMVQSSDLSGKNVKDLFKDGEIHTPKQVIVDRTNHKLYVCDREGLRVHRSNLDGSGKEVLVKCGDWRNMQDVGDKTLHCVGIAVDTKHGKFYWTQKGPSKGFQGRIFRANIEMPAGKTAETRDDIELLFDNLPEPIDLEIDSDTQTLYWTDRGDPPKGNTINKADISKSIKANEKRDDYSILARHLQEAIGIKVDDRNKHIYATDLGGLAYRYDMDGSNCVELFKQQGSYTGIALAHLEPERAKELYGIA
ncbi:Uu.00g022930.m01.CDS01 [Anthostomella pinea]|uniref:Uu.00g022930.m01.CDS01 n=1 Tax=Anthostomella pinea TaxID=933095 RepID=A0AAI8W0L3_9PEZI|nr:Uu.00g022930.m01.CDS01 [Anthostomella pinea]